MASSESSKCIDEDVRTVLDEILQKLNEDKESSEALDTCNDSNSNDISNVTLQADSPFRDLSSIVQCELQENEPSSEWLKNITGGEAVQESVPSNVYFHELRSSLQQKITANKKNYSKKQSHLEEILAQAPLIQTADVEPVSEIVPPVQETQNNIVDITKAMPVLEMILSMPKQQSNFNSVNETQGDDDLQQPDSSVNSEHAEKSKVFVAKTSVTVIPDGTETFNENNISGIFVEPRNIKHHVSHSFVNMLNRERFLKDTVPWFVRRKYITPPVCPDCHCTESACVPNFSYPENYAWKCSNYYCQNYHPLQRPNFYAKFYCYTLPDLLRIIFHWACQVSVVDIMKITSLTLFDIMPIYKEIQTVCSRYNESVEVFKEQESSPDKLDIVEVAIVKFGPYFIFGAMQRNSGHVRLKVFPINKGLKDYVFLNLLDKWVSPHACIVSDCHVFRAIASIKYYVVAADPGIMHKEVTGFHNLNILLYLKRHLHSLFGRYSASTLSLELIQGYFDELQWRERYGQSHEIAFWNIMDLLSGRVLKASIPSSLKYYFGTPLKGPLSKEEYMFELTESLVLSENFELNKQAYIPSTTALAYFHHCNKISMEKGFCIIETEPEFSMLEVDNSKELNYKLEENSLRLHLVNEKFFSCPEHWLIKNKFYQPPERCSRCSNTGISFVYSGVHKGMCWKCNYINCREISTFKIPECFTHLQQAPLMSLVTYVYHWAVGLFLGQLRISYSLNEADLKEVSLIMQKLCSKVMLKKHAKFDSTSKIIEAGIFQFDQYLILGAMDIENKVTRMRIVPEVKSSANSESFDFKNLKCLLDSWIEAVTVNSKYCVRKIKVNLNTNAFTTPEIAKSDIYKHFKHILAVLFNTFVKCNKYEEIQLVLDEVQWRERYGQNPAASIRNIMSHVMDNNMNTMEIICGNKMRDPNCSKAENECFQYLFRSDIIRRHEENMDCRTLTIERKGISILKPLLTDFLFIFVKNKKKFVNINKDGQYVVLSEYYYSWMEPCKKFVKPVENVFIYKCCFCKGLLCGNIYTMNHLMQHASQQAGMYFYCTFCFTEFSKIESLKHHEKEVHLSQNNRACLICSKLFPSKTALISHMKQNHVQCEMPYYCRLCYFRSSFHLDVLAHFSEVHKNSSHLICPFCLKVCSAINKKDEVLTTGAYATHLSKHICDVKKNQCSRCTLSFLLDGEFEIHKKRDHVSFADQKDVLPFKLKCNKYVIMNLQEEKEEEKEEQDIEVVDDNSNEQFNLAAKVPTPPPPVLQPLIEAPLESGVSDVKSSSSELIDFGFFKCVFPVNSKCMECGTKISKGHFLELLKCHCKYSTHCIRAFLHHSIKMHAISLNNLESTFSSTSLNLQGFIRCACGYLTNACSKLALHMQVCNKQLNCVPNRKQMARRAKGKPVATAAPSSSSSSQAYCQPDRNQMARRAKGKPLTTVAPSSSSSSQAYYCQPDRKQVARRAKGKPLPTVAPSSSSSSPIIVDAFSCSPFSESAKVCSEGEFTTEIQAFQFDNYNSEDLTETKRRSCEDLPSKQVADYASVKGSSDRSYSLTSGGFRVMHPGQQRFLSLPRSHVIPNFAYNNQFEPLPTFCWQDISTLGNASYAVPLPYIALSGPPNNITPSSSNSVDGASYLPGNSIPLPYISLNGPPNNITPTSSNSVRGTSYLPGNCVVLQGNGFSDTSSLNKTHSAPASQTNYKPTLAEPLHISSVTKESLDAPTSNINITKNGNVHFISEIEILEPSDS